MRLISICLLFVFAACSGDAPPNSDAVANANANEIFLVRHAEKQTGDDPSLTQAGQTRAQTLAQFLADKGLTRIHSTNFKRTLETAAPIAAQTGLEVELYDESDLAAFADQLKAEAGTHLVVGHSNTTPQLAAALGAEPGSAIDEASEYDRLYVITLSADSVNSRIDRFGVRYQPDLRSASD